MSIYVAVVKCKKIIPIGIPGYGMVQFCLAYSEDIELEIASTCSRFQENQTYLVQISETRGL